MKTRLAVAVYLNGEYIGKSQITTSPSLSPRTWENEIKESITIVCFARKDDLMANHQWSDFTVKPDIIRV